MLEVLLVVSGVVLGGAVAWQIARARAAAAARVEREALQTRVTAAETREDELRKQLTQRELKLSDVEVTLEAERTRRTQAETRLEEQKRLVEQAHERFEATFKALSADVLRETQSDFLTLARQTLDAQLAQRHEAIAALVAPLSDALQRSDDQVRELERAREQAYGGLKAEVQALTTQSKELEAQTANLVNALRSPQVRGRWGEVTLRRVVELAGMAEHCDYVEQVSVDGEGGRVRPDMIVHLPGGRDIVVDSKVPLAAYLEAVAARTPEERSAALARHAQQVRTHVTQLAAKTYWKQFPESPELVMMFIPMESFVATAVEADPALIEDAMDRRVVIATPTTLIAVLLAIAYGWRQQRLTATAAEVRDLGKLLYERLRRFGEYLGAVGGGLGRAVKAYNEAVGSLESRVMPAARRFRELGSAPPEEIEVLGRVDEHPRPLTAPDFPAQLDALETPPADPAGREASMTSDPA